jgi:hypothetical protein
MSGVAKEILGFDVTGMSKDELDARVKALQQDEYRCNR